MGNAALSLAADGLVDAAVEALDHAVGARGERLGEAVLDAGLCADAVERMVAGGFVAGLAGFVDGEVVGGAPFGAPIGPRRVVAKARAASFRVAAPSRLPALRAELERLRHHELPVRDGVLLTST
jgi:hypothetical protein